MEAEDTRTLGAIRAASTTSQGAAIKKIDSISDNRLTGSFRKVESFDSGVIKSGDTKLEKDSAGSGSGLAQDLNSSITALPGQLVFPNAEYKEIMSNIMNFKVDVKLEVQRINQKIGRLEELLSDLVLKLSDGNAKEQSKDGKRETDESDGSKTNIQQKSVKIATRTGSGSVLSSTSIQCGTSDR